MFHTGPILPHPPDFPPGHSSRSPLQRARSGGWRPGGMVPRGEPGLCGRGVFQEIAQLLGGVPEEFVLLGPPGFDVRGRGLVVDMRGGDAFDAAPPRRCGPAPGVSASATGCTMRSGSSAAITTRRAGASGSAASIRRDASAAMLIAAYSSSSSSSVPTAARRAGVTAYAVYGASRNPPSAKAEASVVNVAGR